MPDISLKSRAPVLGGHGSFIFLSILFAFSFTAAILFNSSFVASLL
jgi:hypothetical protein